MTYISTHSPRPEYDPPAALMRANANLNPACEECPVRDRSMCNVLNDQEVQVMARNSADLAKKSGKLICEEGDPAQYIFNIRSGTVRLSKMLSDGRRQITGFLSDGDFFGMPNDDLYCYTAEAITDVEICRFPRKKIFSSFEQIPKLGKRAFEMTRTELHSAHEHMLILGRKTAQEKLSSFLLHMMHKFNLCKTADQTKMALPHLSLPMSRADIADYLGLTVETVSRQFSALQKRKFIELKDAHTVVLREPKRLYNLSLGD